MSTNSKISMRAFYAYLREVRLGRCAKAVAGYLARMSRFGECVPKHETIAEATGYCVRSVQRALNELEAAEVLTWRQRSKRWPYSRKGRRLISNSYRFCASVLKLCAEALGGSDILSEKKNHASFLGIKSSNEEEGMQPLVVSSRLLGSRLVKRWPLLRC